MLVLPGECWQRIVAHCLDSLPLEACGLLAGTESAAPGAYGERGPTERLQDRPATGSDWDPATARVGDVYPAGNAARSARLYTVEPLDLLRADRAAEAAGLSLIGVWHSHTRTPAYPSPTDIAQAPDPGWHYVLVSLSDIEPVLRSYRIVDGQAHEEPVLTPV
ncbi:MAG: Mov34/MPN/PAD-1 family protein [Acidimicrobiales bacterium]